MTGLKIVSATLALLLSMYLYADNAPSVKRGYQATVETGGSVEQQYLEDGTYQTSRYTARAESPIEKYTVYYPSVLENDTQTYPMVLIVNQTGGKATKYEPLLKHLASWGFIVVGTQDKGTGTGETTIQTLNYMLSLNDDPNSRFFQKIDTENIGVTGHSQGGAATFRAITMYPESRLFKTAVPISPVCERVAQQVTGYPYDSANVHCPIFLLAGTSGEFETEGVIPFSDMEEMFEKIPSPKIMARKTDMTHDDMLYKADGYVTAWFMWQLQGDENAATAFIGNDPEILKNPLYQDQKTTLK